MMRRALMIRKKSDNYCKKHQLNYTVDVPLKLGISIKMCRECYERFKYGKDSV